MFWVKIEFDFLKNELKMVVFLVSPYLDETKQNRKLTVIMNQSLTINCPVTAIPEPSINWMFNGQLLPIGGPAIKGIRIDSNGKQVRNSK